MYTPDTLLNDQRTRLESSWTHADKTPEEIYRHAQTITSMYLAARNNPEHTASPVVYRRLPAPVVFAVPLAMALTAVAALLFGSR